MALFVKSKCRKGDLGLKLTLGKVLFSSELVDPSGVARDKLPVDEGRAPPIPPRSGCCCTSPWVALKSFGSGEIAGLR